MSKSKLYELLKTEADGKSLAEAASDMVNCLTVPKDALKEILEDAQTKEKFQAMSAAYVKSMRTCWMNSLVDGRNEFSCRTAKLIMDDASLAGIINFATDWDGAIPFTDNTISQWSKKHGKTPGFDGIFAFYMSIEHRTLQQSFAGLAFMCINEMAKEQGIETPGFMKQYPPFI